MCVWGGGGGGGVCVYKRLIATVKPEPRLADTMVHYIVSIAINSHLASLFLHTLLLMLAMRSSRIGPRYLSTCQSNRMS